MRLHEASRNTDEWLSCIWHCLARRSYCSAYAAVRRVLSRNREVDHETAQHRLAVLGSMLALHSLTAAERSPQVLPGHKECVYCVEYSPDGTRVASARRKDDQALDASSAKVAPNVGRPHQPGATAGV